MGHFWGRCSTIIEGHVSRDIFNGVLQLFQKILKVCSGTVLEQTKIYSRTVLEQTIWKLWNHPEMF